jgi:hypothetical protein
MDTFSVVTTDGTTAAPTPTPTPSTPSSTSSFYGPSFQFDAMGNAQVGGTSSGADNTFVAFRFKAEQSSQLTNFRAYWLDEDYPGYGGGNGGTFRVTVETSSGGMPSGTVLASVDVAPSTVFPLISFGSPATLTAGSMYHLVFTNIDPNPTVNFTSLDNAWVAGSASVSRQPNRSDAEFYAMCRKFGTAGSWRVEDGFDGTYTPIINLTYANGAQQGQGYMETGFYDPAIIAGSSHLVRERITVSGGNRVVTGASVRLAKTSGSGDLVVRLEDASGALIDSFSVPTTSVPTLATTNVSAGVWVTGTFSSPRTLTNGATYNLRLSTDASTSLWTRGIEQGDSFGFDKSTYFTDGHLQATTNGGSTWTTVPGLAESGDLQFHFD